MLIMSKNSEAVKKWRIRSKERIIEAFGGACCICGYNKSATALALHHLDPSKKGFAISSKRANPLEWPKIVQELRKCVLLCQNCHAEFHSGDVFIPNDAAKFNEMFSDYKVFELSLKQLYTPCSVCGKAKPAQQKNCSYACAGKSLYRVNWDSIDLVEELKTKSILKLAEKLGCSDGAIHKRLRKLGLKHLVVRFQNRPKIN